MMKRGVVLLIVIALSACSSIKSIEIPAEAVAKHSDDGLVYFMPKKDFLVTITISEKNDANKTQYVSGVTLGTTVSYPDLSKQFVLRYSRNLFGKNTLEAHTNTQGLLVSTKSTTISHVADVFTNLATTAGMLAALGLKIEKPGVVDKSCQTTGDHSFVFKEPGKYEKICDMTIDIQRLENPGSVVKHSKQTGKEHSGIFYRQNIPYVITAVGNGMIVASLVFSPSESNVHFLPISRTFFSNNDADFEFTDGIPTKFKQDTDSELVALTAIPAEVIGAYFTGIGKVFDSFKSTSQKEGQALTESLNLELAKKKYDACISAINAGKDDLIKQFCQ